MLKMARWVGKKLRTVFSLYSCRHNRIEHEKSNIHLSERAQTRTLQNRGKRKGLSTLVTAEKAFYTWCSLYRFALVVEKSIDICLQLRNIFSLLEKIYVFMCCYKRQQKLVDNLQMLFNRKNRKIRLKTDQTNRWNSKYEAVKIILTLLHWPKRNTWKFYCKEIRYRNNYHGNRSYKKIIWLWSLFVSPHCWNCIPCLKSCNSFIASNSCWLRRCSEYNRMKWV